MLLNPRARRNGLQLFTAAVAGPALVIAGVRYPGPWTARAALAAMGGALVYFNTRALTQEMQPLLTEG